MDPRERVQDSEELMRAMMDSLQARMWTSAPGRIVSFDAGGQTATIQLTVKSFIKREDGTQKAVDIPLLQDVPVQFPGGGGHSMTFPVSAGDEVLVTFSSRSPDTWQQSGGDQVPPDAAMHSLSAGFAILGFRSNPRALSGVSTTDVQVRSDDGQTRISLNKDSGVSLTTNKSVAITGAEGVSIGSGSGPTAITGDVSISGDLVVSGISFLGHVHGGVTPGASDTGVPHA